MTTTDAAERRVDRRIVRTKQRVRKAAVEIATTQGLMGCTMQSIAERAGVARSTIYRHWESPTELLVEALEVVSHPPSPDLEEEPESLEDAIRRIATGLAYALTNTEWGRLVAELVAASAQHPDIEATLRSLVAARLKVGTPFIVTAQQAGQVTTDLEPDYLLGLIVGPIYYRYLIARNELSDQWINTHIDHVHRLIANDVTRPAQSTKPSSRRSR